MRDFSYLRAGSIDRGAAGRCCRRHAARRRDDAARSRQMRRRRAGPGRRHHAASGPRRGFGRWHGASIGALAKMSHVADDAGIKAHFPAVSQALWQAASAQLRNMATIGGNLMQRTRCAYFRDPATFSACNKRVPGIGLRGDRRGQPRPRGARRPAKPASPTYPGDLAVALVAFDAVIHLGERRDRPGGCLLPAARRYARPRTHAGAGEIITAISIPASPAARRSTYLKVRDRSPTNSPPRARRSASSWKRTARPSAIIRVALGGVATKPWRASERRGSAERQGARAGDRQAGQPPRHGGRRRAWRQPLQDRLSRRASLRAPFSTMGGLA